MHKSTLYEQKWNPIRKQTLHFQIVFHISAIDCFQSNFKGVIMDVVNKVKKISFCLFDNWFIFRSTETQDLKVLLPALFGMNLGENETDELTESLTFIKRKANYVSVLGQDTYYINSAWPFVWNLSYLHLIWRWSKTSYFETETVVSETEVLQLLTQP